MKRVLLILLVLFVPHLCWATQPNILVVVADDLDWLTFNATPGLSDLAAQGMRFNGITSTPLCGPSRASILTGKFTHNHGVKGNNKQKYNATWYQNVLGKTFADWCQSSGYHTIMSGKYANPFDGVNHQGWNSWIKKKKSLPTVFWHDRLINGTINAINQNNTKPLLVWYSAGIPHAPAQPSPEYAGTLSSLTLPEIPSFNELNVTDKVSDASHLPLIDETAYNTILTQYRSRAEISRSLVDGINELMNVLNNRPLYVIFISDNGYFQGQHRFTKGKGQPYEEAIHVPMFVLGPDVAFNSQSSALVYAADVAPTVAELCGATAPEVDSRSIIPLFNDSNLPWRNQVLLEHGWSSVMNHGRKFIRFISGKTEMYLFDTDPFEMKSLDKPAPVMDDYLTRLKTCTGEECWLIETE